MEFEQLLTPEMYKRLIGLARKIDRENYEDLTQDALVAALQVFHKFSEGSFYKWVSAIMRNCHWNSKRIRGSKKRQMICFGEAPERIDESPSQDISDEMKSVLLTLNPRHQQLIYLVAIRGYTCEEAAKILSIPTNTVLSGLYRARWKMREGLESAS